MDSKRYVYPLTTVSVTQAEHSKEKSSITWSASFFINSELKVSQVGLNISLPKNKGKLLDPWSFSIPKEHMESFKRLSEFKPEEIEKSLEAIVNHVRGESAKPSQEWFCSFDSQNNLLMHLYATGWSISLIH